MPASTALVVSITRSLQVLAITTLGRRTVMKLPMILLMFSLISSLVFGADIYLASPDGLPMAGFEFQDLTVSWMHAKELAPAGVGQGYPVALYKDPSFSSGWTYDFSKNRREIRAAYRKANKLKEKGRYTVVWSHSSWCGPCKAVEKAGVLKDLSKIADIEQHDIDESNPFDDKTIPVLRVFDADNKKLAEFVGQVTTDQVKKVLQ
jgi:thiol-disulfide isomerase/thioredoxin